MKKEKSSSTIIYQSKTGAIELKKDADTVWAAQADIAESLMLNVQLLRWTILHY